MIALTTAFPRKSSRTSTQAVTVPSTALSSETRSDVTSVNFSAATACGSETALPEPLRTLARRLPDQRSDREEDENGQERRDETEGQGRCGPVPRV